MYTLHKLSYPGWTEKYETLEMATDALRQYICQKCIRYCGSDLWSMHGSPCGLEYFIEGIHQNEPPTLYEQIQENYEQRL